jgi:hypothetical protein
MMATMMIIGFTVIFSELYQDNLSDKQNLLIEDFAYSVQNEFVIAIQTKPGYTRQFEVPTKLEGFSYDVSINSNMLVFEYGDNIFSLPIPKVQGNIVKGTNTIKNKNNTICLNC